MCGEMGFGFEEKLNLGVEARERGLDLWLKSRDLDWGNDFGARGNLFWEELAERIRLVAFRSI